jgi:hypothetical protein
MGLHQVEVKFEGTKNPSIITVVRRLVSFHVNTHGCFYATDRNNIIIWLLPVLLVVSVKKP